MINDALFQPITISCYVFYNRYIWKVINIHPKMITIETVGKNSSKVKRIFPNECVKVDEENVIIY